ncbi:chromosome segregation protein (Pcs1), putative [Talaromyces stipitatus ATCC 10500]|uniref:Chromosome segregation protein (Pcs1), putative n=1 Tax=Talaromyces stipitatus (strain ATCC 10500 / CBS 375.48 / QM 6759 / NRRL 1006) TaxID=441959 RepID=B8MDQ3_TALSN|nr:chromosome segregation protein (Pcs1), putative [Talaromyces stipitatus ATCC 10500]EED18282.1 chromosome segregation protein (Pcs1), putative [Talaromyces stipitatus ATCC 10500]
MPKRKAATQISGLVDSDDDTGDIIAVASHSESPDERPVKKARGRPKSTGVKVEEQTAASKSTRSSSAAPVKQNVPAKKVSNRGRPRAATAEPETTGQDSDDGLDFHDVAKEASAYEEEIAAQEEVSPVKKRRGRPRESESNRKQTHVTEDGEFEYTPTASRQFKPTEESSKPTKPRGRQRKSVTEEPVIPDSQNPADEIESSDKRSSIGSPLKSLTNGERPGRKRATVTFADTVEKASSDPDLRRKLGDMTKKYETLELKYRNLREIGIVEANANFEKIRKQCESATNVSNKLVESLKEELAAQKVLGKESRTLQKQLRQRDIEVNTLQSQVGDLSTQLSTAQTEIKALQTKLAAARNSSVPNDSLNNKGPGSAVKSVANRNAAAGVAAEAAQAAHLAQLKEDLYSDLTGLIIRNVKKRDADYLYDCIQTGANGTLHFKLAVAHDGNGNMASNFDTTEFHYMPLLDSNRDADLVEILPDYLTVDITFSRQNASKFYTRVMDSLTKRRIDPDE